MKTIEVSDEIYQALSDIDEANTPNEAIEGLFDSIDILVANNMKFRKREEEQENEIYRLKLEIIHLNGSIDIANTPGCTVNRLGLVPIKEVLK